MLTDSKLRSIVARAKAEGRTVAVRDTGKTACLEFRASYGGTASFAFVYRPTGENSDRRIRLGAYGPEFSLADARTAATVLLGKRAGGIDPAQEREALKREAEARAAEARRREEAERSRLTFGAMAELYFGGHEPRHRSYRKMYRLNVEARLCGVPAAEITRNHVQIIVDSVMRRSAPVQARRVYEFLRAVLRWGAEKDYINGEPWKGVSLPPRGQARTRVLSTGELRWLWQAAEETWAHEKPHFVRMLHLQILTGQRSGEIAGMERRELSPDLTLWTIEAQRTKNKHRHVVPMPPLARQILSDALEASPSSTHVFVGGRGKVARNDSFAHSISDLIERHNAVADADKQIAEFTSHDLRRTLATGLQQIGVAHEVIAATLNHISLKSSSVTSKHYAHADLGLEVRRALTRWQAIIEQALAGQDPFASRREDIASLERSILGGA